MECRPRRSLVSSPRNNKGVPDVLAPDLLASVLGRQCKQHIFFPSASNTVSHQESVWLLRDDVGDAFNALLEKLLSLSYSTYNKVCWS